MSRVKTKNKDRPKTSKEEYLITQKQKIWFDKRLLAYKTLMGKSVADEANFQARYKEVLSLGRQCAKDRLRAGNNLIDMEREIKSLGYPFWPWLAAQFDERVPERTARRAMEIAWHFETVDALGDRTITDALNEVQEAKAKAKAQAQAKHQDEEEGNDDGTGEEGKEGKESDNVSDGLPIPPEPDPEDDTADEDDGSVDGPNEDADEIDDKYDQESLQYDLEDVGDQLKGILKAMSGDLGLFPDPEAAVKQIDEFVELLEELKAKVPSTVEAAQPETIPLTIR